MKFYEFEIKVIKKPVKYLRLKVARNGDISLNLPLHTSEKFALEFLNKNLAWLRKIKAKISTKPAKNENEVEFLGQTYTLNIDKNTTCVNIENSLITAPSKLEFRRFCDNKIKELLNASISHFAPLINRPINHISFKHMRTRWGSCNHKKGYINLNLNLIAKKREFIEYVVLHELAHLVYPHHKKEFYDLIESFMPDYKIRIKNTENSQF